MKQLVVFDLDGTILDTLKDLYEAVNYALSKSGEPLSTIQEVKKNVGNGIKNLVIKSLTDKSKLEEVFKDFKDYYQNHYKVFTSPYPNIIKTLTSLKEKGIKTAVISNKSNSIVNSLVEFYFKGLFDIALGETEGLPRKPDKAMFLYVLNALKIKESDTLYIGDSEVDILFANNSNVAYKIVTYGFRDKNMLEKLTDNLIDNPLEVLKYL